ncbi:hypothetical protein DDR33_15865 [Pararcticibacter amylolyticus]|uniref:Uncharacterized protein n=1 Tax=Pararcticibacter amylolyticus TaxID=2173175 RepID=A0A2U2PDT3_9SPHI|nr:hypothetical protein DDR33_15865 [Pararcticibacter amylolyticus]
MDEETKRLLSERLLFVKSKNDLFGAYEEVIFNELAICDLFVILQFGKKNGFTLVWILRLSFKKYTISF